ncbi:MAG: hypothetical protein VX181_04440, partial [Pseudomonadota bacterium]|nr:hypothetical protein [Pseudomonadota bacterium]
MVLAHQILQLILIQPLTLTYLSAIAPRGAKTDALRLQGVFAPTALDGQKAAYASMLFELYVLPARLAPEDGMTRDAAATA